VAVEGAERRADEAVRLDRGHKLERLRHRELARRHAQRALQLERRPRGAQVVLGVEQEEVADAAQIDLLGDLGEALERSQRDADVQLVRELKPDTARGAAGRAGCERRALEQDDIGDAELGQVEGDARADGAAAHHDDLGSLGHVAMLEIRAGAGTTRAR
jgi:hypothetical protein